MTYQDPSDIVVVKVGDTDDSGSVPFTSGVNDLDIIADLSDA
jgi:hypothetical protein